MAGCSPAICHNHRSGEAAPKGGPLFVGHAFVGFSSPPTLLRETCLYPRSPQAFSSYTYINGV
jgi:hypothetical protein